MSDKNHYAQAPTVLNGQKWFADIQAQMKLQKWGVPLPPLIMVPIADIDMNVSALNRGRITDKRHEEVVTRYAMAMLDGAAFPAVVLNKRRGILSIMDGNHRVWSAIEAEYTHVLAYVCSITDEAILDGLPAALNCGGPTPLSLEERLIQARFMVTEHKRDQKEAAEQYDLCKSTLSRFINVRVTAEYLMTQKVNVTKLHEVQLNELGRIPSQISMTEAARLLLTYPFSAADQKRMLAEVRSAPSEEAAREKMIRWSASMTDEKTRGATVGKKRTKRDSFNIAVTTVTRKLVPGSLKEIQMTAQADQDRAYEDLGKMLKGYIRTFPFDVNKLVSKIVAEIKAEEKSKSRAKAAGK